ncbi:hypothetical protein D0962_34820 [Leptolyngbyaceae cyanobacterium CCMR0082]|uniref:Uncharacterized protein n=1 Tax=Adonisia turfae CCMR0082 TaxID=2304604 RepID=A0A6M0SH27_9CYAN|nr:hypothetical protein [Adonisia turfae]NEZ67869.1 hypothetical protein [Adonisia turfae CCMR0082]
MDDDDVLQPENFDKGSAAFCDRGSKDIRVKVLCRFQSMLGYESYVDSWMLLAVMVGMVRFIKRQLMLPHTSQEAYIAVNKPLSVNEWSSW